MEGCIHCYKLSNGTLTVIRYWDKILESIMRPCVGAMSSGLHLTMLGFMWQKICTFLEDEGTDTIDWLPCSSYLTSNKTTKTASLQ